MTRSLNLVAGLSALAWAATVAVLTLSPGGTAIPLTLESFLCVGCSERGLADIILNGLLFVPGGLLLSVLVGPRRAVALCAGMTLGIEVIQITIPGRDPAFQDLLFNSLGGWTGARLLSGSWTRSFQYSIAVVIAVSWLAPPLLLLPRSDDTDLFGLWNPRLGSMGHYDGRVQEARVGGVETPSARLAESDEVRRALLGREAVEVSFLSGRPASSLSPIFMVSSEDRVIHLTIANLGNDLVVQRHTVARKLRLDQPSLRAIDALAGIPTGTPLDIALQQVEGDDCLTVAGRSDCRIAPTLSDGWAFLLAFTSAPERFRATLRVLWPTLLGGLLGLVLGGRTGALFGWVLAMAGWLVATASPDVRPTPLAAALLASASLAGALLRPQVESVLSAFRGRATDPNPSADPGGAPAPPASEPPGPRGRLE